MFQLDNQPSVCNIDAKVVNLCVEIQVQLLYIYIYTHISLSMYIYIYDMKYICICVIVDYIVISNDVYQSSDATQHRQHSKSMDGSSVPITRRGKLWRTCKSTPLRSRKLIPAQTRAHCHFAHTNYMAIARMDHVPLRWETPRSTA